MLWFLFKPDLDQQCFSGITSMVSYNKNHYLTKNTNLCRGGENVRCYLCSGIDLVEREGSVRDRPELKIFECSSCGLVFLSSFDHIETGFYEDSGMHTQHMNPESLLRTCAADDKRRFEYLRRRIENKCLLDFGCGAAGFLLRAQEVAEKVYGVEIDQGFQPHYRQKNLDVRNHITLFNEDFDLITLFHVLEHIQDPLALLAVLKEKLRPGGELIIEVPNANDALLTLYRCKSFMAFTYWSCHLYLFNASTLATLASKAGLRIKNLRHIQRYPLANHLHWLALGRPGGHQLWHFLDTPELAEAYESMLASSGLSDTIICSLYRD